MFFGCIHRIMPWTRTMTAIIRKTEVKQTHVDLDVRISMSLATFLVVSFTICVYIWQHVRTSCHVLIPFLQILIFFTLICQRQCHSDINVNVIRISMSRSFGYQCQGHINVNGKFTYGIEHIPIRVSVCPTCSAN